MKKDIEKYIGYYFLVYLVVLAICSFFQYISICNGRSLECAFSMNGINTIITTTAYVLTPIVAIIALLVWKIQHNQLTLANEAKVLIKIIDKDVKLLSFVKSSVKKLDYNVDLNSQEEVLEIIKLLGKIPKNQNKLTTNSGLFYNLSGDENLKLLIENYQWLISSIGMQSIQSIKMKTHTFLKLI